MSEEYMSRSRVMNWEDPTTTRRAGKTLSGIEHLRAMQAGELSAAPIMGLVGMWIAEVDEGRVVFAGEPAEEQYNPMGTVHGGIVALLLDSAMGSSVQSMLPHGTSYTTLELKVNYLRPVTSATGTIYGEGKLIHLGNRTATAEGRLTDGAGELYAHATTTCLIVRPTSV